jgi:hypothetical protein
VANHPQRFVEMIGDRIVVDLGKTAFLTSNGAGEVAEMIDRDHFRVKSAFLTVARSLPVFPDKPKIPESVGVSLTCQLRGNRRAFWQLSLWSGVVAIDFKRQGNTAAHKC